MEVLEKRVGDFVDHDGATFRQFKAEVEDEQGNPGRFNVVIFPRCSCGSLLDNDDCKLVGVCEIAEPHSCCTSCHLSCYRCGALCCRHHAIEIKERVFCHRCRHFAYGAQVINFLLGRE